MSSAILKNRKSLPRKVLWFTAHTAELQGIRELSINPDSRDQRKTTGFSARKPGLNPNFDTS